MHKRTEPKIQKNTGIVSEAVTDIGDNMFKQRFIDDYRGMFIWIVSTGTANKKPKINHCVSIKLLNLNISNENLHTLLPPPSMDAGASLNKIMKQSKHMLLRV